MKVSSTPETKTGGHDNTENVNTKGRLARNERSREREVKREREREVKRERANRTDTDYKQRYTVTHRP